MIEFSTKPIEYKLYLFYGLIICKNYHLFTLFYYYHQNIIILLSLLLLLLLLLLVVVVVVVVYSDLKFSKLKDSAYLFCISMSILPLTDLNILLKTFT